jgi:hemoglobin
VSSWPVSIFGSRARGISKDVLGAMRNDDQVAGLQQLRPAHYCRWTVWRNNNTAAELYGGTTMINNSQRSLRALAMLATALLAFTAVSARTANAADTKSLYERLGGYDGISAVVDEFGDSLFADKRINEFFIGMSDDTRAQFKQKNKNLLCNATGGPCKVISRPAKEAHHGLGITAGDFEVVAGHLKDVLNRFKVGPKEQEEVFAIILSLRSGIVDRPDETRLSREAAAQR